LLRDWQLIESDFLREYRLDLAVEIDRISWRRFVALLNGLSPGSATAAQVRARRTGQAVIDDPDEAERTLERMFA
jgi:hypothetical protein